MALKNRQYYESLLSNPNVRAALYSISQLEGTAKSRNPYRTAFGHRHIADLSKHPGKSYRFSTQSGKKQRTTAAGAYQFLSRTWNGVAKQLDLKDFSPRNQDIAALALIDQRGGLGPVLEGDVRGFAKAVGKEWASFPTAPAAYDQPTASWGKLERAWNTALTRHNAPIPTPSPLGQTPQAYAGLTRSLAPANTPALPEQQIDQQQLIAQNIPTPTPRPSLPTVNPQAQPMLASMTPSMRPSAMPAAMQSPAPRATPAVMQGPSPAVMQASAAPADRAMAERARMAYTAPSAPMSRPGVPQSMPGAPMSTGQPMQARAPVAAAASPAAPVASAPVQMARPAPTPGPMPAAAMSAPAPTPAAAQASAPISAPISASYPQSSPQPQTTEPQPGDLAAGLGPEPFAQASASEIFNAPVEAEPAPQEVAQERKGMGVGRALGGALGGALLGPIGGIAGAVVGDKLANPDGKRGLNLDPGKIAGGAIGGLLLGPIGALAGGYLGDKIFSGELNLGGLGALGGIGRPNPPEAVDLGSGMNAMSAVQSGGAPNGYSAQSSSNPGISALSADGLVARTNTEFGYTSIIDPSTGRERGVRFGEAAVLDPQTGRMSFAPFDQAYQLSAMGVPTSIGPAKPAARPMGPQEMAYAMGGPAAGFPAAPGQGGGLLGSLGRALGFGGGGNSGRSHAEMSEYSPAAADAISSGKAGLF